jgi:hypothetical protein
MAERAEHLLEGRNSKRLVVFEAELADNPAHAPSVEQAGCHGFRQKRLASAT